MSTRDSSLWATLFSPACDSVAKSLAGLGVGIPSGASCSLLTNASVSTQAGATAQLSGTAAAATYCVVVYDIGNQTGPINYSVTVAHS